MTWPENWFNPLQFFLNYLLGQLSTNWLHEFFHAAFTQAFGGTVNNIGIGFLVFYTDIDFTTLTGNQGIIVAFAGGLGSALFCWMWWWGNKDTENAIVWHAIGWSQFLYGCAEGFLWMLNMYDRLPLIGTLAMFAGAIYALIKSKKMWEKPPDPV